MKDLERPVSHLQCGQLARHCLDLVARKGRAGDSSHAATLQLAVDKLHEQVVEGVWMKRGVGYKLTAIDCLHLSRGELDVRKKCRLKATDDQTRRNQQRLYRTNIDFPQHGSQ